MTPVSSGSSESASNAPPIQDAGADTGSPVGLAPHGVPLIESTHVPEVIIDTSGYSLAAPGVQLVEPQEVVPPVIDTSALSLSESGAVLAAPKPADNADIDTRAYSLEP